MSDLSTNYLSERGVSQDTAVAHGLEIDETPDSARIIGRLGTDTIRGNSLSRSSTELIWCPIHDADGATTLWTVRVFPLASENNLPKFITTIGHHAAPFIEPPVWNIASQVDSPLILTEGPIKGMVLSQAGALPIGLQGVWMAAQKNGKGMYDLIPELQSFKWTNRKVYFAFDADQNNNPQVLQALIRTAFLLFAQGAEILQLTSWPLAEGKGIDDYLASKAGLDPAKQKDILTELTTKAKPFIETLRPQMLLLVENELKKVALSAAQFSQLCKRLSGPLKIKGSALKRGGAQIPVWVSGQTNGVGIPQIRHPQDRLDSEVYQEIGQVVSPHYVWFRRGHDVQVIAKVPSGFVYSENPEEQLRVKAFSTGFLSLTAGRAKSDLEDFCEPICLEKQGDEYVEVRKSFSRDFCAAMLESEQFKATLPRIARILPVAIPFRIGNRLVYPKPGFDQQFGTYLMPEAPVLYPMTLERALQVINEKVLIGFGFTSKQSRINAVARLLTPFGRGILGWTERVPIWFYCANRPRSGKDYLAGTTMIIYEGYAFEDQPINADDAKETGKRIMAAGQSGRRLMHFSDCQKHLGDSSLFQASTNRVLRGRQLGSNAAAADLEIPNEMEFSLSANAGMTAQDHFEPRIVRIELEYFEEEANSRIFPDKYLHATIRENRAEILSAMAAIYQHWAQAEFPIGPTTHTSFPLWGDVIGGIMMAAGLGDPCVPFKGKFEVGNDPKAALMAEVFRVCREAFGSGNVRKAQIYEVIQNEAEPDNDQLKSICPLHVPSDPAAQATVDQTQISKNQKRLGYLLKEFDGRFLGGIELVTDRSSGNSSRYTYRFMKKGDPVPKPHYTVSPRTARQLEMPLDQKEQSPTSENEDLSGCKTCQTSAESLEAPKEEIETAQEGKSVGDVGIFGLSLPAIDAGNTLFLKTGENENIVYTGVQPVGKDHRSLTVLHLPLAVALDLETYGEPRISGGKSPKIKPSKDALDPRKGKIRLLSITTDSPVSSSTSQVLDLSKSTIPDGIKELIANASPLIIHGALFDLGFLLANRIPASPEVFCTLSAARLLSNGTQAENDLGSVLKRYLKIKLPKDQGASDWGAMLLTDRQLEYARNDVLHLLPLKAALTCELVAAGLTRIFELESALIPVVVQMEHTGIAVDGVRLRALFESTARRVTDMDAELHSGFGRKDLNLDSPIQLLAAFAKAGVTLTDTAESTLAETAHPLAGLILQYRGQAKFGATMVSLMEAASASGRINGRFNPLGAASGRFSSSGPNLQNVPRGPLRECFIASSPEHRLVIADYSQMELRAAAVIAEDQAMIRAFRAGLDLHVATAAAVLRKKPEAVTKPNRQLAKAVNFGFLYGQRAKGFCVYAKTVYGVELSLPEAIEIRTHFFATYTGLASWHERAQQQADTLAEGRTLLGRRLLPDPDEKDEHRHWNRFQMAINYVVQGSCADILKLAMVKLVSVLPSSARLLLTVHDELVLECAAEDAPMVAELSGQVMKEAFREVFGETVPAEVDTRICQNWGEK